MAEAQKPPVEKKIEVEAERPSAAIVNQPQPTQYKITRKDDRYPYKVQFVNQRGKWDVAIESSDLPFIMEYLKSNGINPQEVPLDDGGEYISPLAKKLKQVEAPKVEEVKAMPIKTVRAKAPKGQYAKQGLWRKWLNKMRIKDESARDAQEAKMWFDELYNSGLQGKPIAHKLGGAPLAFEEREVVDLGLHDRRAAENKAFENQSEKMGMVVTVPGKSAIRKDLADIDTRTEHAIDIDKAIRAEEVVSPTDKEGVEKWKEHPERLDVQGIDTPSAKQARKPRIKAEKPKAVKPEPTEHKAPTTYIIDDTRSSRAIAIDQGIQAKNVVTRRNKEGVSRWKAHPNQMDVRGVDTLRTKAPRFKGGRVVIDTRGHKHRQKRGSVL